MMPVWVGPGGVTTEVLVGDDVLVGRETVALVEAQ
jgi:hypothetical protein